MFPTTLRTWKLHLRGRIMLLWRLPSAVSFIHSQANIKAWWEPVSSLQQLDKAATTPWPSPTMGWNAGTESQATKTKDTTKTITITTTIKTTLTTTITATTATTTTTTFLGPLNQSNISPPYWKKPTGDSNSAACENRPLPVCFQQP